VKNKEKIQKNKKKIAKIDPNWSHILQEPYCMIRTYRGLVLVKKKK